MNTKRVLIGLLLVGVVAGAGILGYRYFVVPVKGCDICGRAIHATHQSEVVLDEGPVVHACCARCALHLQQSRPADVAQLWVSDADTGLRTDATDAFYVEGSSDHPCRTDAEAPPREPGVGYELIYDRCLPSLVAFRERAAALEFQKRYGGRIVTFDQALESVQHK